MFQKIVLAVDGSEHALSAARVAGDLARAMHSEYLWVVVVYDPISIYLGEPNLQQVLSSELAKAESIFQLAIEAIGQIPGKISKEILEGSPAEQIINVANVRKSELIVMGSRGLGKLAGLVLGSQSQKVVSHAPCPVMIVR
jgi:nucleotide-binding universal stress UspA family protein